MIRFFLLLVYVFVAFTSYTYAQLTNSYSIDIGESYNESLRLKQWSTLFVSLYEDNTYTIDITDFHWSPSWLDLDVGSIGIRDFIFQDFENVDIMDSDIQSVENVGIIEFPPPDIGNLGIMHFHLSIGKYEINNNFLILTDSYTHHQFVYQLDNSNLYPIKTYPFLMEKYLIDNGEKRSLEDEDYRENEIPAKKTISDLMKKKLQKIIEGRYFFWKFQLELKRGNQFVLFFNKDSLGNLDKQEELNLIFFTGKWKQKGNILILSDTNFQHTFYGLIQENGIEIFIFPMKDVVFEKKSDN